MGTDSSHQIQSHPHNISSITKNSSFFKRKKQILMLNYLSLGKGKSFVKIWICFFRSSSTVWSPRLRIALSIKRTIFLTSSSKIPLVVIAEIPILTPEGRKGGRGSWGISDLETEIPTWSSTFSTSAPSNYQFVSEIKEAMSHNLSIFERLLGIMLKTSSLHLSKCNSNPCNGIHMGSSLHSWENCTINPRWEIFYCRFWLLERISDFSFA